MATLQISLPEEIRTAAEAQASQAGYQSVSDYVRDLILADGEAQLDPETEAKLLEAMKTPAREIIKTDWDEKRRRFEERHASGRGGQ